MSNFGFAEIVQWRRLEDSPSPSASLSATNILRWIRAVPKANNPGLRAQPPHCVVSFRA